LVSGEFFASYPAREQGIWCSTCLESTDQIAGIVVNYRGIIRAYTCKVCQSRTYAKDEDNPFEEINEKLDKILRKFG